MTYIGRNQWDIIVRAALLFGCIYGSDVLVHANPFSHRAPSQVWLSLHVCTRAPGPPVSGPCITLYIYMYLYVWPMAHGHCVSAVPFRNMCFPCGSVPWFLWGVFSPAGSCHNNPGHVFAVLGFAVAHQGHPFRALPRLPHEVAMLLTA